MKHFSEKELEIKKKIDDEIRKIDGEERGKDQGNIIK